MRLRSSNPVLRTVQSSDYVTDRPVTYANVAFKTIFLVMLAGVSGFLTLAYLGEFGWGLLIGAFIVAFISVIIGTRSVRLSPIFAVTYAISEGAVLGVISALYESLYEGIVPTAFITTLIVLVVMMLFYSTGIIKVTQRFASILVIALVSVILMSLLSFILPFGGGQFYYIVAIISAILSALFLLLDFESIKSCVESGSDAKLGWVLSLGLMVTLVWIYIEILRLLAIFTRNQR